MNKNNKSKTYLNIKKIVCFTAFSVKKSHYGAKIHIFLKITGYSRII